MATANATVRAVLDYLNQKSSSSVPTGAICYFATTAIPTGWLLCNGSNVSRTTYAALFAAIGTKFGTGNGSSTFTLPNLDERFIEGTTTTSDVGKKLEAGLPNISGSIEPDGSSWSFRLLCWAQHHWATCAIRQHCGGLYRGFFICRHQQWSNLKLERNQTRRN